MPDLPSDPTVVGNKVVFANNLTIHGDLSLGDRQPTADALEILSLTCSDGVIDVSFRNPNRSSSLIKRLEITLHEIECVPDLSGLDAMRLPATYQYHGLLTLDQGHYEIPLSQEVPAGGLDRFQVILAFARSDRDPLFPPFMPGSDFFSGPLVDYATVRAALTFAYDLDRIVEVPEVRFGIRPLQFGYRASKPIGTSLGTNAELLFDEDDGVVISVIYALAQMGDPAAIPLLRERQQRPGGDAGVRNALERTIAHLEQLESEALRSS